MKKTLIILGTIAGVAGIWYLTKKRPTTISSTTPTKPTNRFSGLVAGKANTSQNNDSGTVSKEREKYLESIRIQFNAASDKYEDLRTAFLAAQKAIDDNIAMSHGGTPAQALVDKREAVRASLTAAGNEMNRLKGLLFGTTFSADGYYN